MYNNVNNILYPFLRLPLSSVSTLSSENRHTEREGLSKKTTLECLFINIPLGSPIMWFFPYSTIRGWCSPKNYMAVLIICDKSWPSHP